MTRSFRGRMPAWLALALTVLVLAGCQREQPAPSARVPSPAVPPPADVAEQVPVPLRLQLATVDGGQFDLQAHRGQWVLVNVWATWCSPCLKEMPELSALDAMREHISVIGIAQEDIDTAAMQAFLERHPVVYPVAIVGPDQALPGFDGITGLPMTFLVAPDGTLAKRYAGVLTAEKVEADIAALGGPAPGA